MIVNKPYNNKDYADLAVFCNENDCHIEDKGDYLESVPNEHPEIEKIKERVAELHSLLESTDWVANKITDLMVLKPEGYEETIEKYRDVLLKRQEYRDELNGLENE